MQKTTNKILKQIQTKYKKRQTKMQTPKKKTTQIIGQNQKMQNQLKQNEKIKTNEKLYKTCKQCKM